LTIVIENQTPQFPTDRRTRLKIITSLLLILIVVIGLYRVLDSPPLTRVTYAIYYTIIMDDVNNTKYVIKTEYKILDTLHITEWLFFGNIKYVEIERNLIKTQTLTWEQYQVGF
jgi:hypothetical protein